MPTVALPDADFKVVKKKIEGITRNYVITPTGEEVSFKELAKKCGVAAETFYGRLHTCSTFVEFTAPKGGVTRSAKKRAVKQSFELSAFFVSLLIKDTWKPTS